MSTDPARLTDDEREDLWRAFESWTEGDFSEHMGEAVEGIIGKRMAAIVERDTCGGCRGIGSHRRHCPRHPDYHPWIPLADRAESIGDSIGVPELANRAWALAGAIRDAMPDHPYRPARYR